MNAGAVAGAVVLLVALPLVVNEVGAAAPGLAERLLRRASKRLPLGHRTAQLNQWLGDLDDVPGEISKLVWALGMAWSSRRLRVELAGADPTAFVAPALPWAASVPPLPGSDAARAVSCAAIRASLRLVGTTETVATPVPVSMRKVRAWTQLKWTLRVGPSGRELAAAVGGIPLPVWGRSVRIAELTVDGQPCTLRWTDPIETWAVLCAVAEEWFGHRWGSPPPYRLPDLLWGLLNAPRKEAGTAADLAAAHGLTDFLHAYGYDVLDPGGVLVVPIEGVDDGGTHTCSVVYTRAIRARRIRPRHLSFDLTT